MKKINLLFYIMLIAAPFATYAKFIEIIAQDGTILHVSDSETIQGFFEKCRKDMHCTANYQELALDFNNKLIKEGSLEANRTLYYHSSWSSNKAIVAKLQYPQPRDNRISHHNLRNTLIDVEAPNGRIKQCSLNDTPSYFFKKCRNSGDCRDINAMTLKFGNFEIKEDSEAANRPFYAFQTDSCFAQVKRK